MERHCQITAGAPNGNVTWAHQETTHTEEIKEAIAQELKKERRKNVHIAAVHPQLKTEGEIQNQQE
ncbi:Hypothetical predicted protein, partial [Pelobates cultripes]